MSAPADFDVTVDEPGRLRPKPGSLPSPLGGFGESNEQAHPGHSVWERSDSKGFCGVKAERTSHVLQMRVRAESPFPGSVGIVCTMLLPAFFGGMPTVLSTERALAGSQATRLSAAMSAPSAAELGRRPCSLFSPGGRTARPCLVPRDPPPPLQPLLLRPQHPYADEHHAKAMKSESVELTLKMTPTTRFTLIRIPAV